jgi:hypothetical protein
MCSIENRHVNGELFKRLGTTRIERTLPLYRTAHPENAIFSLFSVIYFATNDVDLVSPFSYYSEI